ncbi:MAG: methyltransferase [Clostridia bacterium]|nr:methyltransferase [Clostridia bacterium]
MNGRENEGISYKQRAEASVTDAVRTDDGLPEGKSPAPELLDGERLDDTGFGGIRLIQKPEEFCYGIDAVLLADFAASFTGADSFADLGTGTGIVPLLLSHMTAAKRITGIEFLENSFKRAERNARLNGLTDRVSFVHADVSDTKTVLQKTGTVQAVVSNPPYMKKGAGLTNSNGAKFAARHETTAGIEDFVRTAAAILEERGDFFLVHRPMRLVDICTACRDYRLEPKHIRFVSPDRDSAPNIMLLHCVKSAGSELRFLDPLSVYSGKGVYSDEINRIYGR